jgi:hypothetical protein
MLALAACSSEPASSLRCKDYEDPALYAASAGFASDVLPIFERSCNFGACHGSSAERPQEDLWLGPHETSMEATAAERSAIIDGLVGVRAHLADMAHVVPGEPAQSFLLAKLEYTDFSACETNGCAKLRCGGRMPRADPPLTEDELALIRTWIRDGARDD